MPHHAVEQIYQTARDMRVDEVMTDHPVPVDESDPIETAIERMLTHRVHRLPVFRNGVSVGILARHDLLQLIR